MEFRVADESMTRLPFVGVDHNPFDKIDGCGGKPIESKVSHNIHWATNSDLRGHNVSEHSAALEAIVILPPDRNWIGFQYQCFPRQFPPCLFSQYHYCP